MHRRFTGTMIGCLALLTVGVAPAVAEPANSFVVDDVVATIADDTNDLVAFGNTTRAAYCSAEMLAAENAFFDWVVGGEVGDPPEFPMALGATPVTISEKSVGSGNIRVSFDATVPVELWTFEAGKAASLGNLRSPCIDTDGILDGTDTPIAAGELFAAGTATWSFKDNDGMGTGPRTNIWGDRIAATVTGPGSTYAYTVVFKNQARDGEYLKGSATFNLQPR